LLKLTDLRCHAEPKAKHLGNELSIRNPDDSFRRVPVKQELAGNRILESVSLSPLPFWCGVPLMDEE